MKRYSKFSLVLALSLIIVFCLSFLAFSADTKALIKALNDEKATVRSDAALKLGELKAKEAVKPLLKMLKTDKSSNVRIVAAVALLKIGDETSLPEIKKLAEKDQNQTVRTVLQGVVKKMEEAKFAKK